MWGGGGGVDKIEKSKTASDGRSVGLQPAAANTYNIYEHTNHRRPRSVTA